MIRFIMWTDHDVVDGERFPQLDMHAIQFASRLISSGNTRLICRDDNDEANRSQFAQQRGGFHSNVEFFQRHRADGKLALHPNLVQEAVSFNENTQLHAFEKSIKLA